MTGKTNTGTRQHPLQSRSRAFNRLVRGQDRTVEDLEAGRSTGAQFNQQYRNGFNQYLKDLGMMSGHGRRR